MSRKERGPYDPPKSPAGAARVVFYILSAIVILLLALTLYHVLAAGKDGEPPSVLGYSLFIVTTDSMEPEMPVGSAAVVRRTDPASLKAGDIITFREGLDVQGKLIVNTHRIAEVTEEDGQLAFRTKGDNSPEPDETLCTGEQVYGRAVFAIPKLGDFFNFIKTPLGLLCCIALPLVVLLIIEVINLICLSRKNAGEEDELPEEEAAVTAGPLAVAAAKKRSFARDASEEEELPPVRQPVTGKVEKAFPNGLPPVEPRGNSAPVKEEPVLPEPVLNFHPEVESVPLENPVNTIGGLSYVKPEVVNDDGVKLYATREFALFPQNAVAPEAAVNQQEPPAPVPEKKSFAASLSGPGKDRFQIEGIDVKVKPDSLSLSLADESCQRDIFITVAKECTRVTVANGSYEVNFSLLRSEQDDTQKVVIQKKRKPVEGVKDIPAVQR